MSSCMSHLRRSQCITVAAYSWRWRAVSDRPIDDQDACGQSAKTAHHALRRLITNRMYARELTWNVAPHEVRLKRYEPYLARISRTEKRKRPAGWPRWSILNRRACAHWLSSSHRAERGAVETTDRLRDLPPAVLAGARAGAQPADADLSVRRRPLAGERTVRCPSRTSP